MEFRNLLAAVVLLFAACTSFAQSKITETVPTLNPSNPSMVQQVTYTIPSGFTYSGQNPAYNIAGSNIGMSSGNVDLQVTKQSNGHDTTISVTQKIIYRTIYTFYLNPIKYTPTNHISITNVKLHYGTASSGYTFKITQPPSDPIGYPEQWSTAGNSSSKQTGIPYSGYLVDPASGLSSAISSNLPAGVLYLGVVSEGESTSGSVATFTNFYMEVTYQRDNEARTVIAQNDMDGYLGGQIYWDGGSPVSSPQTYTLHEGETHTFGVVSPQTHDSYQYIWNTAGTNTSVWTKKINTNTPTNQSSNTSIPYTTTWNELGTITYTAYMKKVNTVNLYKATEFDGTIGPTTLGTVVTSVPFSAQAPSSLTIGGNTYQFAGWSDGVGQNPRTITTSGNVDLTALYKVAHKSNDASAFTNNSERKFVRTTVGTVNWLHQVYTSMGHVWIEHSSDGVNWTLGNGGQPLDNGSGKCPSIDFYGTTLVVAFQQQEASPNTYSIRLTTFIPYNGSYIRQAGPNQLPAYFETSDPYSTNANPSIAWGQGYYYLAAFERKSTTAGISYVCGVINPDGTPYAWGQGGPFHVNGTNGNSIYPTVHSNRWASYAGAEFELAYEQYTSSYSSCINETPMNVLYSGSWNNSVTQMYNPPGTRSSGSFPVNYRPSVVQLDASNNAALCWIRDQSAGRGDPYSVNVVYWNTKSPSIYTTFGLNAQSVSLNLADNSSNAYFSYSQYWNGAWTNYASNGASGVLMTLNTTGQDVQLSNGPIMYGNVKYMYTSAFNRTASPYSFSTSYLYRPQLIKHILRKDFDAQV